MRQSRFDAARVGALSDGVFAIAMTLLVLDLKPPELGSGFGREAFAAAIEDQAPRLASPASLFSEWSAPSGSVDLARTVELPPLLELRVRRYSSCWRPRWSRAPRPSPSRGWELRSGFCICCLPSWSSV